MEKYTIGDKIRFTSEKDNTEKQGVIIDKAGDRFVVRGIKDGKSFFQVYQTDILGMLPDA